MKRNLLVLGLALAAAASGAAASERLESPDFALLETKADALAKKFGRANVLIAYDIDNTLLDLNQDLGSDQWFNWQTSLLSVATREAPPEAVARSPGELVAAWGLLVNLASAHPTDPRSPGIVHALQEKGFPSIVVTARGPGFRDATLRELDRNGYHFRDRPLAVPSDGRVSTFLPKIPDADAKKFDLGHPRPVDFVDGVLFTAGQHKGALLKALVAKAKAPTKAVLFIDDTPMQVDRMQEAFAGTKMEVVTIRYAFDDAKVAAFKSGSKDAVVAAWRTVSDTLGKVFPK